MTPESIETGLARVIIGAIGIVVAIVMLLGFIPSIALGLGGIDHKNIWSILYGLGFLLSFFGNEKRKIRLISQCLFEI